ncbi:hypothetical protein CK203_055092 [Vitis vinifera]|uniref:Uncharacterized protein n=1 Tax=Vitis vinifera TaxID=29760 RepID=A0A438GUH1_VITVI|nr:hypothetical protein CK203_055092 [Vitis vinifera]
MVDDHNDKDASVSSSAPSWEKIVELLKQVPYFKSIFSCIRPMQEYTAIEATKVAVEAMKAFFTQRLSSNEKLRTYLEQADSDLAATKKAVIDGAKLLKEAEEEREVAKVEVCRMKEERETAQAGFAAEKELEDEFQKQVDDMFFFGYQCCMRKNDITQDIPSYPSDEEDVAVGGSTQGDKDLFAVGPSDGQ